DGGVTAEGQQGCITLDSVVHEGQHSVGAEDDVGAAGIGDAVAAGATQDAVVAPAGADGVVAGIMRVSGFDGAFDAKRQEADVAVGADDGVAANGNISFLSF